MPALPSIVSTYIDGLIDDLQQGASLDLLTPAQTHAAGASFLRAMDLATALELLQSALTTGSMTVVSGSTTTVVDGASTFVANQQVGNYVLFGDATTTVALRGQTARIKSNTTTTLTLAEELPDTPVAGDVYSIVGGFLEEEIAEIRAGKAKGEAVTPIYSDSRLVNHAILKMYQQLGGTVNNLKQTVANLTAAAGGSATEVVVNVSSSGIGKNLRIDEFKNMEVTVAALGTCVIDRNDEDTLYLRTALTGAPTAADAVTIRNPQMTSSEPAWHYTAFNGGHGQNVLFGDLLDRLKTLVVAYTLPT